MKTVLLILFFSLNAFSAQSGLFMVVVGKVFIEKSSGEKVKAKTSSVVNPGDSVVTGPDSKAKIVMSDRNIINVLPNTRFVFKKYTNEPKDKNVELKLEKGRIRTDVEQKYDNKDTKFEIKSGVAVVGVRGTQLVVTYDEEKSLTEVVTLTGEVMVEQTGKLSGAMGFGKTGQVILKSQERVFVGANSKSLSVERLQDAAFEALKKETAVGVDVKPKSGRTN